ncbi:FAD-dependent monooxygenase [Streptomyces sp. NPDC057403]|uniref:FAD-dependent monooxygenase n=1 Tax=Streptomyces sp. NPDC057403 TaxID=3346119 RepID=UPI0036ADEA27
MGPAPWQDATAHTDVLVVGAGPAGLALTLMLLRSGVQVTLAERSTSLRRDFHGEILQPGGQLVLDDLGVLKGASARGAHALDGFEVRNRHKVLLDIDYRRLPPPHNRLLALPQPHLLAELLAACERQPGFTYLHGHRISALPQDAGRTTGAVLVRPGSRRITVRAAVVVGADGRFSKTRALAGITAGRREVFDQDVAWFTLPAAGPPQRRVRIHRAGTAALLVHDTHPDRLRIGWTLPHGAWNQVAAQGIDGIRRELAAALPSHADALHTHLTSLSQLSLLDVFAAHADTWTRDGLVLLGDAAHTHGPLGAQGINLALQDAAVLHPVLLDALAAGDLRQERLGAFEQQRRPVADAVTRIQRVQSMAFFGTGGPVAEFLRARAAAVVTRTPAGARITSRIAYGRTPVRVRTELFTAAADGPRAA